MEPDELPRQLGEDDELPDDFGSRIGDTLIFRSGVYARVISADDARRLGLDTLTELHPSEIDRAAVPARGFMAATNQPWPEPGSVLDNRPRRRGLNRLIPTGRRRAARRQPSAPVAPVRPRCWRRRLG